MCDTIAPSLDPPVGSAGSNPEVAAYLRRKSSDLDVAGAIERTLARESGPADKRRFRLKRQLTKPS